MRTQRALPRRVECTIEIHVSALMLHSCLESMYRASKAGASRRCRILPLEALQDSCLAGVCHSGDVYWSYRFIEPCGHPGLQPSPKHSL